MLIDSTHCEEVRVAVLSESGRLEDFDFETASKKNLKGNIYLAKVIRIEPSLQAAFVEYGGDRHGFLAFDDIHPDYFRIPIAERAEIESAEEKIVQEIDDVEEEGFVPRRLNIYKNYKIQEVLKRGQIMLVQVVKEERGNKGAALTTYLSLAGRYCVLMPNAGHGCGGVSRKISDVKDRKRLRAVIESLNIPDTMGLIVRTAGMDRTKLEIRRDSDYLLKLWGEIRDLTMDSVAPALIHEESNLIKRSIRDVYSKDIDKLLIQGEEGYKEAKNFIKMLMPSHAKKIQQHKDPLTSLFQEYKVDDQIDEMYSPVVPLKSGGSLIINPTEALVSIDVNSGKATKERHIEETAIKTNLEAAEEVARVLRLRDLAGIVVIDFIDMEDEKNVHLVERKFREFIKSDRARIQVGRISMFGLLELSRQRLRPSILEASTQKCIHCAGLGVVRSVESSTLQVLRTIETEASRGLTNEMTVTLPHEVCMYLINQKREALLSIEQRFKLRIWLRTDNSLIPPNVLIDTHRKKENVKIEKVKETKLIKILKVPVIEEEKVEVKVFESEKQDEIKKISRSARRRKNRLEKQRNQPSLEHVVAADGVVVVPEAIIENESVTSEPVLDQALKSKRKRVRNRKKPQQDATVIQEFASNVSESISQPVVQKEEKVETKDIKAKEKTVHKKPKEESVGRPMFEGLNEEKKLVLTGETFKLGRPFMPIVSPNLKIDISEESLRKEFLSEPAPAAGAAEAGAKDDSKSKKGRAWWQKLLK